METQVISPLLAHDEMAAPSMGWVLDKLESLPDYVGLFEAAFGGGPSVASLGSAIALWERSLLSANSPFDRWFFGGESQALNAEEQSGFALFRGKAGCSGCHLIKEKYALFTDNGYHDTGISHADGHKHLTIPIQIEPGRVVLVARDLVESVSEGEPSDLGRFEITLRQQDMWHFKTPGLRNIALTAPYMHDGSLKDLNQVVHFYNQGGKPHEGQDPKIRPLNLDENEQASLVRFLKTLTGDNRGALIRDARHR